MKKDYNRNTTSDIPLDASFNASTTITEQKKPVAKPKINAIGKKATNNLNSKNSKSASSSSKRTKSTITKTKKEAEDLEKLNEESLRTYQTKSKRNNVVIILLAIAIAAAIAVISIYVAIIKLETNCDMIVHGADAVYIIDGEELSEFRTPSNIQGNSILRLDIKIKINEEGPFNIKFIPECYQEGNLIDNTLIYEPDINLFYEGGDGYYYSKNPIEGNQTIQLCGGIILDYKYEGTLNVENFKLKFHTYFEKV